MVEDFLSRSSSDTPFRAELSLRDAGLDSLDLVVLALSVEEASGQPLSDHDLEACRTLGDVVSLLERLSLPEPPTAGDQDGHG